MESLVFYKTYIMREEESEVHMGEVRYIWGRLVIYMGEVLFLRLLFGGGII